jgi:hypothetical protein
VVEKGAATKAGEMSTDAVAVASSSARGRARLLNRDALKARILTRASIDGRTRARKQFDAIAEGIAQDLGGQAQLSTVQRHLVEAFAGAAIHVHDLNARLLLGEEVDIMDHSQAISTMVRIASRIGIHRVAREVTPPSLQEYLAHRERQRALDGGNDEGDA